MWQKTDYNLTNFKKTHNIMKYNIKKSFRVGALAVAGALAIASCTDDWNEHYEGTATTIGQSYAGTTMGYLQSQSNLSDFVEVLKATGYVAELNDPQVLTVLAPVNGSFNKDSLMALVNAGQKKQVVNRFVKNHLMRYNISLGGQEQEVYLLNDKRVKISPLADLLVQHSKVQSPNIGCSNGIVQVMSQYLPYQTNIYELIEDDWAAFKKTTTEDLDSIPSLYNFLNKFNVDSLDERRSVYRGVDEDGNNIYVDSVMIRNNKALSQLRAYLYREDSTYMAIIPSQKAYEDRYNEAYNFFHFNTSFNSDPVVRDSMQNYYANYYTVSDLFYNMSQHMNGPTKEDSLFSTVYSRSNPKYDVYYHPYAPDSLLSRTKSIVECSNGEVRYMDDIPYTKYQNFFREIKIEAENHGLLQTGEKWTNANATTWFSKSTTADSISGGGYMIFNASSSTRNTEFSYDVPRTLSGTYDIYVRFLPYQAAYPEDTLHTNLPVQFRAGLFERNEKGTMPESGAYQFRNPADGGRNFLTNPNCIDEVYIGSYTFKDCYHNTSTVGAYFQLSSYVTSSQKDKYTKNMIIDYIIFKPHVEATEEEDSTNE